MGSSPEEVRRKEEGVMEPSWFEIAARYLGVKEIPGAGSNPTIMTWVRRVAVGPFKWIAGVYKDDDIAWCALFVNNCLVEAGLPQTGLLSARSFQKYGRQLVAPRLGCILVFDGGLRGPGFGHVGFYVGETADGKMLRVRGGNQNNAVSEIWMTRKRLLADGMRWPFGVDLPVPAPVVLESDGMPASTSEG
jgi:uncharacterized protein (TIGR02594 family)